MTTLLYQIRIKVTDRISNDLRTAKAEQTTKRLLEIAENSGMELVCTFDAFKDYCVEAERNGIERYHLYNWTKATIEDPNKKEKYLKSFAFYQGDHQIYSKSVACKIKDALLLLNDDKDILEVRLIDSHPANNPQPPK